MVFVVYLKFNLNWTSHIVFGKPIGEDKGEQKDLLKPAWLVAISSNKHQQTDRTRGRLTLSCFIGLLWEKRENNSLPS